MDESFYIFLNNNISKKRYSQNDCNRFTTDIYPVIQLDSAIQWEVAIISAIIPFIGFKEENITSDTLDEKCIIDWHFFLFDRQRNKRIDKEFKVIFRLHEFINKSIEDVIKFIINHSYIKSKQVLEHSDGIKISILTFQYFFVTYLNRFVLKSYTYPNILETSNHPFFQIDHVKFKVNDCFQKYLGLNQNSYTLFTISQVLTRTYTTNLIVGEYSVGDTKSPPKYISVYSDLITGNRYGDQVLSIMDILPFSEIKNYERKITTPVYSTLRTNTIESISILILNERNKRFTNHTQDTIFTLHFRKKKKIE